MNFQFSQGSCAYSTYFFHQEVWQHVQRIADQRSLPVPLCPAFLWRLVIEAG